MQVTSMWALRSPSHPNLARLDLVSLRLVLLCTERGSLSLAASACALSLSGASGRVARIEHAFGRKLFDRHPRGLVPTADGLIVAQHARRVLDVLGEMTQSLARAGAQAGPKEESRRELSRGAHGLA